MIPRAQHLRFRAATRIAVTALLLVPCVLRAIEPVKIGGAIEGRVSDSSGTPQMGAVVQVFNHQDQFVGRISTDDQGLFTFGGLLPDVYSIRVSLATFLPAFRSNIIVEPGASSLLDVSLSGLFSVIRVLPPSNGKSGLVNDDWKWVLRSSSSSRPVFRYSSASTSSSGTHETVFRDSEGLVRFSAGDMNSAGAAGEMGTAFAFATNVFGTNNVQFAGDVGYGLTTDSPSASIRATYSRNFGGDVPEITITARQIEIPRWSEADSSQVPGEPPLRTLGASIADTAHLADSLDLAYGMGFDSVGFVEHQHYYSPFARLTWDVPVGVVELTFTAGNARPELGIDPATDTNSELQHDVLALNEAPAVTVNDGHMRVQRGQDVELSWSRSLGSNALGPTEVRVTGYRESVQNAGLLISGNPGASFANDLVPDLYTDSLLFDAGNYHTMGFTAALTQHVGDYYQVTVTYGTVGVLSTQDRQLASTSPNELRSMIGAGERQAVTALATATVPHAGTHFDASYQFMDDHDAMTAREYSTDANQTQAGLNFTVRQPIPSVFGLPFRMEADAELRNLLAEGYLPLAGGNGQRLYLVHNPRIVRGGLNFRF